jgi:hypothetical protein
MKNTKKIKTGLMLLVAILTIFSSVLVAQESGGGRTIFVKKQDSVEALKLGPNDSIFEFQLSEALNAAPGTTEQKLSLLRGEVGYYVSISERFDIPENSTVKVLFGIKKMILTDTVTALGVVGSADEVRFSEKENTLYRIFVLASLLTGFIVLLIMVLRDKWISFGIELFILPLIFCLAFVVAVWVIGIPGWYLFLVPFILIAIGIYVPGLGILALIKKFKKAPVVVFLAIASIPATAQLSPREKALISFPMITPGDGVEFQQIGKWPIPIPKQKLLPASVEAIAPAPTPITQKSKHTTYSHPHIADAVLVALFILTLREMLKRTSLTSRRKSFFGNEEDLPRGET